MALGIAILLSFLAYTLWRYILLAAPQSWIGLEAKESQEWAIVSRSGKIYNALLRKDSQIFPGMITLRFNIPDYFRPVTITLFKDSLMPDEWRRLRAFLKWVNQNG
jgi:hypothetical protein